LMCFSAFHFGYTVYPTIDPKGEVFIPFQIFFALAFALFWPIGWMWFALRDK
jgi:hypothetical protein